jgi:hypothetical protein
MFLFSAPETINCKVRPAVAHAVTHLYNPILIVFEFLQFFAGLHSQRSWIKTIDLMLNHNFILLIFDVSHFSGAFFSSYFLLNSPASGADK